MLIYPIGRMNSMCQNNNTISDKKLNSVTKNNVSFGAYWLNGCEYLDKSDWAGMEKLGKILSEQIYPKRRIPKDGVWGVIGSKLNNMIASAKINPEKLTDYKIRIVHIHNRQKGKNGLNKYMGMDRVLRRTFTQNNGQITYCQDQYPNGKLVTDIIRRNPRGETISNNHWVEMIG